MCVFLTLWPCGGVFYALWSKRVAAIRLQKILFVQIAGKIFLQNYQIPYSCSRDYPEQTHRQTHIVKPTHVKDRFFANICRTKIALAAILVDVESSSIAQITQKRIVY